MRIVHHVPLAGLMLLAACGAQSPGENAAEALENAAEQSDPAAALQLENAADAARAGDQAGLSENAIVQNALQAGGAAQVDPQPSSPGQAKPHAPGESVPPPQIEGGR